MEWTKAIGIALFIAWGARLFIFTPIVVEGASMMPTFEDGDRVAVDKIGHKLKDYDRFDVIVFEVKDDTHYIKRIIGMPGDRISYENDELLINGKRVEEPYLEEYKTALDDQGKFTEDFALEEYLGEAVVPDGSYFVLGDNRRRSIDSRNPNVGFVSEDQILGTVRMVLSPLSNVKIVD